MNDVHHFSTRQSPDEVVTISGLRKCYGDHLVVDDVDLVVNRGEIVGIVGTNGAGKTTTVECAQGLRRPDSGSVRVLGLDPIRDRGRLRGRVGSQLQDSNLPERLRVGEAVRLFATSARQAEAAMDEWDLEPLARIPFAKLSGGQQQRLFLALALINRPEVVFLDELTQGLDPAARRSVWTLIDQVRDRGTTVVLVTHFMEEAEILCDRLVVMTNGRVVDTGTPDELIGRHGAGVSMRFTALQGPTATEDLAWLRESTGVESVHADESEIEVRGSSAMIAHVGAALVARGEVPEMIRVTQPDLEAALLHLIDPSGGTP